MSYNFVSSTSSFGTVLPWSVELPSELAGDFLPLVKTSGKDSHSSDGETTVLVSGKFFKSPAATEGEHSKSRLGVRLINCSPLLSFQTLVEGSGTEFFSRLLMGALVDQLDTTMSLLFTWESFENETLGLTLSCFDEQFETSSLTKGLKPELGFLVIWF